MISLEFKTQIDRDKVVKVWGTEEIIANANGYCGKILRISPGYQCSLHYHPVKNETFLCLAGPVQLQVGEVEGMLTAGDSITILAGTPHRFAYVYDDDGMGVLIEFSSTHSDDDVVRLEPSGPIS